MKHKIVVITTEFLAEYIRQVFMELKLNCSYKILIYKTFKEIPELISKIPKDTTGILTSGSFPAQVIRLSAPNLPYIIMPFNTDDESICRLFLRLLDEDRTLDFRRISADVTSVHNVSLHSYLTTDLTYSLAASADEVVKKMKLPQLFMIEEKIFQQHLHLWNSNKIDLCVTRFSSLVEPLRQKGVKVYFPYPSMIYMNDVCQKLFKEIEYCTLQDHCPAFIAISVTPIDEMLEPRLSSLEHHTLLLQSALIEFLGDSNFEYVFRRTDYALEIITQHKNVHKLTENERVCKIQEFLRQKAGHKFFIGYGLGLNLDQARNNALCALQKAENFSESTSFLVSTDQTYTGPLLLPEMLTTAADKYKKASTGFSHKKKKEVLTTIRSASSEEITSQELAKILQITKRSANRLLSVMLAEGLVEIARTQPTASKGRPERIYRPASFSTEII